MEELSKLERMLILMKKYGVTDLKLDGIEVKMVLGHDELTTTAAKKYSDEDLLFYSSNP